MIRCRSARRFIDAALERELALEQRFELEQHVERCPACAEHERRARALQELLEGSQPSGPGAPDVDAAARAVFARLERGEGRIWRPRRGRRAAKVAGAVLVLAAAVVLAFVRASSRPPDGVRRNDALDSALEPAPVVMDASPAWSAASVEVTVRAALLASFATAGADEARALARFDQATREPARSGWSVRRFVEGLLECPDIDVALAAGRYLAALGDASAAPALERALQRSALADGALAALGALGGPALAALGRALAEPELAPRALLEICRIGGPRATDVLERAAREARDDASPSREALLDALTTTGPAAVASLLHFAAECDGTRADSTAILARLPLVERAGPELVRCLERERLPGDLGYRALLLVQPAEALPWLEERCATHRERASALETLASFPGTGPLESALRLAQGGRVPHQDVLALLDGLLERDAERAEAFTLALLERGESAPASAWLALLIESAHPGAARALVPLVFDDKLAPDDQQWAALAVGELGSESDAQRLLLELGPHATADRRRTAACLLSIHAHLGAAGPEALFASCSRTSVRRVLAALEAEGSAGEAVLVHRVARALDGALAELSASADPKETL